MRVFKRKIYNKLKKWKSETEGTKALLIEGARRIGDKIIITGGDTSGTSGNTSLIKIEHI